MVLFHILPRIRSSVCHKIEVPDMSWSVRERRCLGVKSLSSFAEWFSPSWKDMNWQRTDLYFAEMCMIEWNYFSWCGAEWGVLFLCGNWAYFVPASSSKRWLNFGFSAVKFLCICETLGGGNNSMKKCHFENVILQSTYVRSSIFFVILEKLRPR